MSTFMDQATTAVNQELEKLSVERFAALGIDPKQYGLEVLTVEETRKEISFCKGVGTIKIPYYGIDGKRSGLNRYRFLGQFEGFKYYQQKGTPLEAYLPPGYADWATVLQDVTRPLIITEGEFKSICGVINGFDTIGLGGVSSFTKDKYGQRRVIEPLNTLPMGKTVYIAYDYDGNGTGEPKQEVAHAEESLAAALMLRGCKVKLVRLGTIGLNDKVGLDDFLIEYGINGLLERMKLAKPFKKTKRNGLIYLLSNYAILNGDIVKPVTGTAFSVQKFGVEEANCCNEEAQDDKTPPPTMQFIRSIQRTDLAGYDFEPNEQSIITVDYKLNLWRGYRTQPKAGDVKPWLEFKKLFFSAEPELEHHFDQTIAHMFQYPGRQQTRILIIKSGMEGIGKSFFFETIAGIINGTPRGRPLDSFDHALVTSARDLNANHNSLMANKRFVVFNEIGERGDRHTNLIKDLATAPSITVNPKYLAPFSVKNYAQLAITTNESYTHIIDQTSRRELVYVIPKFSDIALKLRAFFETAVELKAWINTQTARESLMHYYMHYDISDYDGTNPAPMSEGKSQMIIAGRSEVETYFFEDFDYPPYVVPRLEVELYRKATNDNRTPVGIVRSRLRDLGYTNTDQDKTNSQIKFAGLEVKNGPKELHRPVVWCYKQHASDDDRDRMYNELFARYFGGRKV